VRKDHALRVVERISYGTFNGNPGDLTEQLFAITLGNPTSYSSIPALVTDFSPPGGTPHTTEMFLQKESIRSIFTNQSNVINGLDVYYFRVKQNISSAQWSTIEDVLEDDNGIGTLPNANARWQGLFYGYIAQTYLKLLRHKVVWVLPGRMYKPKLKRNWNCKTILNYDYVSDPSYLYRKGNLICLIKTHPPMRTLMVSGVASGGSSQCYNWTVLTKRYVSWRVQGQKQNQVFTYVPTDGPGSTNAQVAGEWLMHNPSCLAPIT